MFWLFAPLVIGIFVLFVREQLKLDKAASDAMDRVHAASARANLEAERKKYADTLPAFSAETERCMELHDVVRGE